MRRSLRGGGGTETARPLDIGRFGKAVAQPGIDPRHWVSYGTVCTINANGTPNYFDPAAVYLDADGCYVDVLLSPTMQHVTARYPGVQGGPRGTVYSPIGPGDEVLVALPEGDLSWPPVIVKVMSGEHSRLPMNPDRTPIWQNDRVLLHGNDVKVHTVAQGGGGTAQVEVNPDGGVVLNLGTAGAARVGDSVKVTLTPQVLVAIATAMLATGAFTPSGSQPSAPPTPVIVTDGEITSGSETVKVG